MSTSRIAESVLRYKIGTSLANIHILKVHLRQIELQWERIKTADITRIHDQIGMAREHINLIDEMLHGLDAQCNEGRKAK